MCSLAALRWYACSRALECECAWRQGNDPNTRAHAYTGFVGAMLGPLVYSSNRALLDPKIAVLTAPIRKAWGMSRTSVPEVALSTLAYTIAY